MEITAKEFQEAFASVQTYMKQLDDLNALYMPKYEQMSNKYNNKSLAGIQEGQLYDDLTGTQRAKISVAFHVGRVVGIFVGLIIIMLLSYFGGDSGWLWGFIFGIIGGIVVSRLVRYAITNSIANSEAKGLMRASDRMEPIIQNGLAICNDIFSTMKVVPRPYAQPKALRYINSYFSNGRSDNLKEAINLYESDQSAKDDFQYLFDVLEYRLKA